jgi:hypothetical protein
MKDGNTKELDFVDLEYMVKKNFGTRYLTYEQMAFVATVVLDAEVVWDPIRHKFKLINH